MNFDIMKSTSQNLIEFLANGASSSISVGRWYGEPNRQITWSSYNISYCSITNDMWELIFHDRHATYRENEGIIGICGNIVRRFDCKKTVFTCWKRWFAMKHLYDNMTCCESWIYAYEPENKEQSIVWVFKDEPNPTNIVRARNISKEMVPWLFLEKSGTQLVLRQEVRKKNLRRRITL